MAFSVLRSLSKSVARTTTRRMSSGASSESNAVYGGGPKPGQQRVTLANIRQKYKRGEPLTMVTAYDYPSGAHVDSAGIDICLVGDSAAMVVHGHDNTLPITLDEMLVHCRAVARGAKRPFLVGDLPFGSYESSTQQAVDTTARVLKEGGMNAIKLEGASPSRIASTKAIVDSGVAVLGHTGLTPQAISVIGGFRPQGRNVTGAVKMVETALALEEAGCFAVVLECVPPPVSAAVTSVLKVPTLGIGAGPFCSGQTLVYHDLLGVIREADGTMVTPRFCKQYVRSGDVMNKGLIKFKEEVSNGAFPGAAYSPYKISVADMDGFFKELQSMGFDQAASAAADAAEKMNDANSGRVESQLLSSAQ